MPGVRSNGKTGKHARTHDLTEGGGIPFLCAVFKSRMLAPIRHLRVGVSDV